MTRDLVEVDDQGTVAWLVNSDEADHDAPPAPPEFDAQVVIKLSTPPPDAPRQPGAPDGEAPPV